MALQISKGKILVDITPEELLKFFGINMREIIDATAWAIQDMTGDYGNSTLYLSDLKGNEEQILDAILYLVKTSALENIKSDSTNNNADFLVDDDFYHVLVNGIPTYTFDSKEKAIEDAFSIHNNGESDVRVENSVGNILWDSTYINPDFIKSLGERRLYEKRKNTNCDD